MKSFKPVLSVIISFLLTLIIVFVSIIINVNLFFSSKNIIKCTEKINMSMVFDKIRNSGSVSDRSVINDLYELTTEFDVSKKDVDKIINSKLSKQIIGMVFGNLTDYMINNKNSKIITSDDVYDLIDEGLDDVLEEVSVNISDTRKEKFMNRLKLELPDALTFVPTAKEVTEKKKELIKKVYFVCGDNLKLVLIILGTIFSVLIIVLSKRNSFIYLFVSFLCSGLIIILLSLFVQSIIMSLIKSSDVSLFINAYSKMFAGRLSLWGFILCLFSGFMFLINRMIEKK